MKHVLHHYRAQIAAARIREDAAQIAACATLDTLLNALKPDSFATKLRHIIYRGKARTIKGVYIYGGVGRGKSMVMDMFFDVVPSPHKWRVHFHAFMLEVHDLLARARTNARISDPIPHVAKVLARRARLICFDEFQVNDIADASILGRLFDHLWRRGVVVVATSNCAPDALYAGGLNRQRFLAFIEMLKRQSVVQELASPHDYRLAALKAAPMWFYESYKGADKAALDERFATLTGEVCSTSTRIMVQGRVWDVPSSKGVARLSFDELCSTARGAADYWALAQHFHTLIIDDIPTLHRDDERNAAARFITLIDALYEHKVTLLASALCAPDDLYRQGQAGGHNQLPFARTRSRLQEMQSSAYLSLAHNIGMSRDKT